MDAGGVADSNYDPAPMAKLRTLQQHFCRKLRIGVEA